MSTYHVIQYKVYITFNKCRALAWCDVTSYDSCVAACKGGYTAPRARFSSSTGRRRRSALHSFLFRAGNLCFVFLATVRRANKLLSPFIWSSVEQFHQPIANVRIKEREEGEEEESLMAPSGDISPTPTYHLTSDDANWTKLGLVRLILRPL